MEFKMESLIYFLPFIAVGFVVVWILFAIKYRQVVDTNMVHTVQTRKKTTSYGAGRPSGNVYYAWPSWLPFFGVKVIKLTVSNFDLSLKDYEAYDKDRVPFRVDVTAFFRIEDTNLAAERVENIAELKDQLSLIVQGAVRKVLASDVIDSIMLERSKFGDDFSKEVVDQLKEWGVTSVKSMELMDIRDTQDSKVIQSIMAKKTSFIEMESRKEVAGNRKTAENAEIEAQQLIDIRTQESQEAVGKRTAEKDKAVGIANQTSRQEVLTQEKETRTREMDVERVKQVKTAEIEKDKQIVAAEQDKETQVIRAQGGLESQEREAKGITAVGEAKANVEKAMQLAPVQAQITLAKEIGENAGYQKYLAMIEAIKAYISVGGEQAKALQNADVKVISNAGKPSEGVKNVMDLFTSQGGTNLSSMVEAFAQTPFGEEILSKLGVKVEKPAKEEKSVDEDKE